MKVVEITADVNGVIMRGEDYASDVRKAFDKCLKNIERQIKKHKSFLKEKARMKTAEVSFEIEGFVNEIAEPEEKKEGIVKTKKFSLPTHDPRGGDHADGSAGAYFLRVQKRRRWESERGLQEERWRFRAPYSRRVIGRPKKENGPDGWGLSRPHPFAPPLGYPRE